ncbi:hypothetical protein J7E96_02895 [Streptomyces sp. ISL-96]|uniref:hypothetical protein n=1 Tax=Streptomyces sp. ISL-96 TaxID=2819191 RepID=UPI001BE65324|nr:hypothetical protein [Streptomyces sp. ISL-96]MBT2487501.1 hypothetical protein [Streptomyces sp. ISL-96]
MLIGRADIYLNHNVIRIGSKEPPAVASSLGGAPMVASDSHIHVAARAQTGPVRVKLWNRAGPVRGTVVFDGQISLSDGSIAIGDILNVSSFVQSFGSPGLHQIRVSVDDPGNASRVDVVLDPGVNQISLMSVEGGAIPYVWTVSDPTIGRFDELALVLSSHDLPVSRLSAALKLVQIAYEEGESPNREYLRDFGMRLVAEWLRWLRDDISHEVASEVSRDVAARLRDLAASESDYEIIRLASGVIESLHRV